MPPQTTPSRPEQGIRSPLRRTASPGSPAQKAGYKDSAARASRPGAAVGQHQSKPPPGGEDETPIADLASGPAGAETRVSHEV